MYNSLKILIVDDHPLVLEGIRLTVANLTKKTQILTALNCLSAKQHIAENNNLDLILLDINLPDGNGMELLQEIISQHPLIPVVMLSGDQQYRQLKRAIDIGARGYITKTESKEVTLDAIQLVLQGGIYLPPSSLLTKGKLTNKINATAKVSELTARQDEVLQLLIVGKSNKAIARTLDIAEPTVRVHVSSILKILEASNRTEAANIAKELGLIKH